jgi:RecJ-like exonuclease
VNEKNLLRVSLVFSLLGLLILFYITYNTEIKKYDIGSLNKDYIDKIVRVNGAIESFSETPGLYLITIKDNTGKITVIVFKDEELELQKNMVVEITGIITEYNNKIEIISKQIVI